MATSPANAPSRAKPFIKWVGGKQRLTAALLACTPPAFQHYHEPFLGGGALFYGLQARGKTCHLSDINAELITTYKVVQNQLPALVAALQRHAERHSPSYYYAVRSQHQLTHPVEVAARFIYLLKTCFNGLYRVNRKNEFNTPIGSYARPNIVDLATLTAAHIALQTVSLTHQGYETITPAAGDLVYFDPPYHSLSKTAFVGYSPAGFGPHQQQELRDFALKLSEAGVYVMLSNADSPLIRHLYAGHFNITSLQAPRLVNCRATGRTPAPELIITNYPPPVAP